MSTATARWLTPLGGGTGGLRLFCFPHAGAGQFAYREWPALLPDQVEAVAVVPPGRDGRAEEPPCLTVHEMVRQLLPELLPRLDRPFAFFGHSLGALIAFETAAALVEAGGPVPVHLLLSGRRPLHLRAGLPLLHDLPEAELLTRVAALGGVSAQVLGDPRWSGPLLRLLRADLAVDEKYEPRPCRASLPIPLTVFGGRTDQRVPAGELRHWSEHTSAGFAAHLLPGGHFYLTERRAELIAQIVAALRPALQARQR